MRYHLDELGILDSVTLVDIIHLEQYICALLQPTFEDDFKSLEELLVSDDVVLLFIEFEEEDLTDETTRVEKHIERLATDDVVATTLGQIVVDEVEKVVLRCAH
jgi:hypothetical protein